MGKFGRSKKLRKRLKRLKERQGIGSRRYTDSIERSRSYVPRSSYSPPYSGKIIDLINPENRKYEKNPEELEGQIG